MSEKEDAKIEDILKSIRGIMDKHNSAISASADFPNREYISESDYSDNLKNNDENILELTQVVEDEDLLSEEVRKKTSHQLNKFTSALKNGKYKSKDQPLDILIIDLAKPLIKNWLDNNLPRIVEEIVSEEIKKIIPK